MSKPSEPSGKQRDEQLAVHNSSLWNHEKRAATHAHVYSRKELHGATLLLLKANNQSLEELQQRRLSRERGAQESRDKSRYG